MNLFGIRMPRSYLNAGNRRLHVRARIWMLVMHFLNWMTQNNTESFDRKVKSNDKRINLNCNFHGTTESGEFEWNKNEFDCQICEFGREILYYQTLYTIVNYAASLKFYIRRKFWLFSYSCPPPNPKSGSTPLLKGKFPQTTTCGLGEQKAILQTHP